VLRINGAAHFYWHILFTAGWPRAAFRRGTCRHRGRCFASVAPFVLRQARCSSNSRGYGALFQDASWQPSFVSSASGSFWLTEGSHLHLMGKTGLLRFQRTIRRRNGCLTISLRSFHFQTSKVARRPCRHAWRDQWLVYSIATRRMKRLKVSWNGIRRTKCNPRFDRLPVLYSIWSGSADKPCP